MSKKNNETSKRIIISLLAENKELQQAQIIQLTKMSNNTIISNLKFLYNNKYIDFREEPSSMGGKNKKIWTLTFKGIVCSLQILYHLKQFKNRKLLKKIINTQSEKMLIFEKWSLFEKAGLEDLMFESLEFEMKTHNSQNFILIQLGMSNNFDNFPIDHDTLNRGIIAYPLASNKGNKAYFEVLKNDPELNLVAQRIVEIFKQNIERDKQKIDMWSSYSNRD